MLQVNSIAAPSWPVLPEVRWFRCRRVVEEYGEWKPEGAPPDSLRAMHAGQPRFVGGHQIKDKIAYAFGAEFVEIRVNRFTHESVAPGWSARSLQAGS
ncbi:hypothetical protein ABIA43_004604 [Bradyrhizobium sp. USDA 328]